MEKKSKFEIWAQFHLSKRSVSEIHEFFRSEFDIRPEFLISDLHLTIYHARRPMPELIETNRACHLTIDTLDTRFMVMAPGGENPRPELDPARRKVGIRVKRSSSLMERIYSYRDSLIAHETEKVLGLRKPSSKRVNAFGSRHFQPHISILRAQSGIMRDLTIVGESFRDIVTEIHFDRYSVKIRRNY